jgi:serine/threonine-protein kinase
MARPDDGETFEQWAEQTMPPTERRWVRRAAIAAAVVGVLAGGAGLTRFARPAVVVASEMGTLRVDTNPAGLQVLVDGIDHGRTPARLSVSAGAHVLEVRGGSAPRVIPITVASGLENSQYVEFAAVAQNGQLRGASGAAAVDAGSDRTLPLTTTDRAPEPRDVIPTPTGSGARAANMQAGAAPNVSAIASSGAAATPTWGWIAVTAAFPADIRVGGKVLGAAGERIRMTAGYHEIAVVNEERGYRTVRAVDVVPGRITSVSIPAPAAGLVNFNASPWAEVWIGTRRIGETPLANVSVPAGQHEVVFRHPQLGEKRQNLRVNPGGHMRLSIEMK